MFGALGRWSKIAIALLALAFACLLVFWIFLTVDTFRQTRRAEELLRALGNLELGTSSVPNATSVVRNFGGMRVRYAQTRGGVEPDCDVGEVYNIAIAPHWIDQIKLKVPLALRLGLVRDWSLNGAVHIKNGTLTCVTYTILLVRRGPAVIFAGSLRPRSSWNQEEGYSIDFDPHPRGHALVLRAYPDATTQQHAAVFRPDLHCLYSLWGCIYPCELSPSAWHAYLETAAWQHLVLGWGKPPDANDSRCGATRAKS